MADKPTPPLPAEASIDQIGIVVRDVQAMAETLYRTLGIGPFRLMEWPLQGIDPQSTYHGQPRSYRIRLGFARAGAAQIELVQPLDDQSIWSDFLASHGPGLHHFRITVTNFDETVEGLHAAGFKNIASGTGAHIGSKWAYFDTADLLEGIVIEVRTRLEGADGEGRWATEGTQLGGT
jgi:methylmalonyl-CoA/ethylmalonyl-CoA epimerase